MNICLSLSDTKDNKELIAILQRRTDFTILDLNEVTNEKVTVITNGPLTELSNILMNKYELENNIEQILVVGGSDAYGDVTPAAEKNIYADPNAAQHVFLSGIKIVMFGLNVTTKLQNRALAPLVYLINQDVFTKDECGIYVETLGKKSLGKTVTDVYSDKQFDNHNAEIMLTVNLDKFNQVVSSL